MFFKSLKQKHKIIWKTQKNAKTKPLLVTRKLHNNLTATQIKKALYLFI